MKIFYTKAALNAYLDAQKKNKQIGFVPTMGALHEGHLSLLKKCKEENDISIVSIFVNPTQFDNSADLVKYPKTFQEDTKLLESAQCDVLFAPDVKEIYAENITATSFDFDGLEQEMEGRFRTGHFDGVGTVVKRLFEIVAPNKAYFGEKDFQQLQIVKKMTKKQQLPVKVKGCKIYRAKNGLAMSSRNSRLTEAHLEAAPFIFKILQKAKIEFRTKTPNAIIKWVEKEFEKQPLLNLEYFTIADEKTLKNIKKKDEKTQYRAFIAVFAGEIRLIDNIQI
ncbi:MAG: pantoate--beta-alanine ligase [Polaribacter sp.]|jgi:pantoate--beta-alanine ligase|nr:pantoate--beta-alanine ligase [Polaribacter sp.]MBT5099892.1 pantoate--beta-alanine ligase [Polaribacter sp.]MBT7704598.1 pantoate--beta-alanine ligase [Polaribacter sp.]MDA9336957.1 pantoate--beta-alanine ligase [Polaribacter sp.]MDB4181274.1 pantoate--beta-alanine ligase [Polaribacter sp.]